MWLITHAIPCAGESVFITEFHYLDKKQGSGANSGNSGGNGGGSNNEWIEFVVPESFDYKRRVALLQYTFNGPGGRLHGGTNQNPFRLGSPSINIVNDTVIAGGWRVVTVDLNGNLTNADPNGWDGIALVVACDESQSVTTVTDFICYGTAMGVPNLALDGLAQGT